MGERGGGLDCKGALRNHLDLVLGTERLRCWDWPELVGLRRRERADQAVRSDAVWRQAERRLRVQGSQGTKRGGGE